MKINSFYILILILMIALLFITRKLYHGNSQAWVGVAEARDYTISSEKQATVKAVHVVQGQAIHLGDTLVQLSSLKLIQDMERLETRIEASQSEKDEKKNLAVSEIELTRSSHAIDVNRLEKEILLAESELKLNKEITQDLKLTSNESKTSPLEEKVKSIKEEINLRNQSARIKISDLHLRNNTEQIMLGNQIQLLKNELALMQKEKESLLKIALADGVVEAVPVKIGDEVDAYTKLVSVLPTNPTSVIGYLRAGADMPPIGTKVQIQSYDARWKTIEGQVIGYGTITSLPEILQKSTAVRAFGKEIFIEMSGRNEFSTGEKLLITVWEE